MTVKKLIILSIVIGIFSVLFEEGLFFCNFSCIRLTMLFESVTTKYIYQMGYSFLVQILFLFVIGGLYSLFSCQNENLRNLFILCGILFFIFNLELKLYTAKFNQLGLLGEVSLFTWIIFVYYTFFYSILFIKREEQKKKEKKEPFRY